jgi:hypothetical protein
MSAKSRSRPRVGAVRKFNRRMPESTG